MSEMDASNGIQQFCARQIPPVTSSLNLLTDYMDVSIITTSSYTWQVVTTRNNFLAQKCIKKLTLFLQTFQLDLRGQLRGRKWTAGKGQEEG